MSESLHVTPRPQPRETPLAAVIGRAPGAVVIGRADVVVTGVTHDSRAVLAGDLYAALPGAHTHGARFAAAAIAAGATAVLTDPDGAEIIGTPPVPVAIVSNVRQHLGHVASLIYGDPSHHMQVLGVTGTNGKTTVTWLLAGALQAAGVSTGVIGTAGVHLGDVALPSARTTPEAPDLQALLAVLRERGAAVVAMEVSSHALELRRVDGTRFNIVGFTHLTQDHLDFHGTMEHYFRAKQRLFTSAFAQRAAVVIDDQWGQRITAETDLDVTTVATTTANGDWAVVGTTETTTTGQRLNVRAPDGATHTVTLRLAGDFNAANALLALAMACDLGEPSDIAIAGLASVDVPGRMQRIDVVGAPIGIVDYAHTPDAVERAVRAAATAGRPLVVVLGAGGDRDASKRPLMGRAAAALADVVVITDDNPRSEDPALIRGSVASGTVGGHAKVSEVADRRSAIGQAVELAGAGGVALILGKGHETGQEIAGVMQPFDDRLELRSALENYATRNRPS